MLATANNHRKYDVHLPLPLKTMLQLRDEEMIRKDSQCHNSQCIHRNKTDVKLKSCSKCLVAKYCSKDCQVADFSLHKHNCKKTIKVKSVSDINNVCVDGEFPDNTCIRFNVNKFKM